jgi:hypothetical protein
MSFRKSKRLRVISIFLLLQMAFSISFPTVSWALTAGPTAPEATSFEPVDTTDIVDLKTGDFTYNIPLLEVPGPAGGYPLSLSYHAGIQPDQEASWTGLGWTLNPGSIFRLVNGYPDDHNAIKNVVRDYWSGGETTTKSIGLSFGIGNGASVSAGLVFANDTYRGRGTGGYLNGGVGRMGANASVGINLSPYGGSSMSAGFGAQIGNTERTVLAGLSVQANSDGIGLAGSLQVGSSGASIFSNSGSAPMFSLGGVTTSIYNANSGRLSTNSTSESYDVPLFYGIGLRLARSYTRYWIDEYSAVATFGSLNLADVSPAEQNAFDTYDLTDIALDAGKNFDPEKMLGGSFPDVDLYSVMAQGLGGTIKPHLFRQYLYRQDRSIDGQQPNDARIATAKSYVLSDDAPRKAVEYRFVNDFSNRFEYDLADFTVGASELTLDFSDDALVTGKSTDKYYNTAKNHLAGSKHVEWYTNNEINLGDAYSDGFVNCLADGYTRGNNADMAEQVGGFMITNSTGVTYHFALPAYSYQEKTWSQNNATLADTDGMKYNTLDKETKYAYTWYLTAVTGPDYVDRNANHIADKGDWGYWVNFAYKKWIDNYQWRNPAQGMIPDLDNEFESYSSGLKEIYYLETVSTETHVAEFRKSERWDGRESMNLITGSFLPVPVYDEGCINIVNNCIQVCDDLHCINGDCSEPQYSDCKNACPLATDCPVVGYQLPRPSLRLDEIRLFSYRDFVSEKTSNQNLLRSVGFIYDYSLAPGTPNSINPASPLSNQGKLSLKSIKFSGKKGVSLVPPMSFSYKNVPYGYQKNDAWGLYKNDFDIEFRDETNDVIARRTTGTSAVDVDAWSLNNIETPLGAAIQIEYQSDKYVNVALDVPGFLRIKSVVDNGAGSLKLNFWENVHLADYFQNGMSVDLSLLGAFETSATGATLFQDTFTDAVYRSDFNGYASLKFDGQGTITSINSDPDPANEYLVVSASDLYNTIKTDTKTIILYSKFLSDSIYQLIYTYSGDKAWPSYFPAGIISYDRGETLGGGLAVKSVTIAKADGSKMITGYSYADGTTSYEPYQILAPKLNAGFKAAVHTLIEATLQDVEESELNETEAEIILRTKNEYRSLVLEKVSSYLNVARVVPGPGVLYGTVTVKEENVTLDGVHHELPSYSVYSFQTFNKNMIDLSYGSVQTDNISGSQNGVPFSKAHRRTVLIKDYSASVGNLNSISLFDSEGNELISRTTNHFLNDNPADYEADLLAKFDNQGVIQETFARARIMFYKKLEENPYPAAEVPKFEADEHNLLAVISSVKRFPNVPVGQSNTNYKTNISTTIQNVEFDFISGDPTKIVSTDSYGMRSMTVSEPAYKRYSAMGLKIDDIHNRNMLSQSTGQASFIVNDANVPTGVLAASRTTWSNQVPVLDAEVLSPAFNWRQQAIYQWAGTEPLEVDGSYPISDFSANLFSYDVNAVNAKWEKTTEATMYDRFSHMLEAADLNGNFVATRMGDGYTRVLASAVNARYGEMGATSTEYYAGNSLQDGGVSRGEGAPVASQAHTGRYSLSVGIGKTGFTYTLNPGTADLTKRYRASVWVYAPGDAESQEDLDKIELFYTANGIKKGSVHPFVQKNKSKSWYLLNLDIAPQIDDIVIAVKNQTTRGVYFDDFRVHPLNSSMSSYVYDQFSGELTYILNGNNLYTKFDYDAAGRLVRSSQELLNFDFGSGKESFRADLILQENIYNYGKSN